MPILIIEAVLFVVYLGVSFIRAIVIDNRASKKKKESEVISD